MLIIYGGTVLISLFSASCDNFNIQDKVLSFESKDLLVDFSIEPVDIPGYHLFKEQTVRPDLDSLFEANNYSADQLKSITLVTAILEITGPSDTMSLNYLDMVKITIYTPELGEGTIAENLKIPADVKKIELDLIEGDMKDYLEAEEYILTVYGFLNTRSYDRRELEARIKYKYTMTPGF